MTSSAAPVVKDSLVKKPEVKAKVETTSTFQAFKRTEVKVSSSAGVLTVVRCLFYTNQFEVKSCSLWYNTF